jgi:hypothetical protein
MSWFKRTPKAKEPQKALPQRYSPATKKMLEEAKKLGPSKSGSNK